MLSGKATSYTGTMNATAPIGDHLRTWRQRRHLSQLDLALEAEISTRHLSFLETGRSRPSREMILRLADHLRIPLREQNVLLNAAGFAARFPERTLDQPDLAAARRTIDLLLKAHEPFPALAVDRHWHLVTANAAIPPLMAGAAAWLLEPPINVVRLSLHPDGIARRILNYVEWKSHMIERLVRQLDVTADPFIADLIAEARDYPVENEARNQPGRNPSLETSIAIPLQIQSSDAVLSFISTTTVFGTPVDVTLSEIAIETFFPADEATARVILGIP
jgi:transcriptional regulator with XRE-family HTH domain